MLITSFQISDNTKIDSITDLTSIIWTIHTKFRQDSNRVESLVTKITDEFEFQVNDRKWMWKNIKTSVINVAGLYDFKYETTEEGRAKTGILGSILALIDTVRRRLSEKKSWHLKAYIDKG